MTGVGARRRRSGASLCVATSPRAQTRLSVRAGHARRVDGAAARFRASCRTSRVRRSPAPWCRRSASSTAFAVSDRSGRFEMRTLSPGPYLVARAPQRLRRVARSGRSTCVRARVRRRRSRCIARSRRRRRIRSCWPEWARRARRAAHRPRRQPTRTTRTRRRAHGRRRSQRSWRGGCVTRAARHPEGRHRCPTTISADDTPADASFDTAEHPRPRPARRRRGWRRISSPTRRSRVR